MTTIILLAALMATPGAKGSAEMIKLVPCSTDADCEKKNIKPEDPEEIKEIKRRLLYI